MLVPVIYREEEISLLEEEWEKLAEFLNDLLLRTLEIRDWAQLLGYLAHNMPEERFYIIIDEFMEKEFFSKNGYFYRESYFIISLEFKGLKTYFSILNALAYGHTKPTAIAHALRSKAVLVNWHCGERKEDQGIIAVDIEGEEELRKQGFLVYGLADFGFSRVEKARNMQGG